ncbi:hypothetical protein HYY72_02355 [Candidatus Woesearchaeota archaeon]|nr:hypothetical protein [Candidatus Woesearchaeota archaeon]
MIPRQIAYRIAISRLLGGRLVEGSDESPSYVAISDRQISRVNIIGTVITKSAEGQDFLVDDGTGTVRLRGFGSKIMSFDVSDIINVIGRVRFYNQELYISIEIASKADEKLMKLRALELEMNALLERESPDITEGEQAIEEEDFSAAIQLRELIRELDRSNEGKGADIMEVARKSSLSDAEEQIMSLIQLGEVFEIRPGRLKVLE